MRPRKAILYTVDGVVEEINYYPSLAHLREILKTDKFDFIDCQFGLRMWFNDNLFQFGTELNPSELNWAASNVVRGIGLPYYNFNHLYGTCLLTRHDDDGSVIDHELDKCYWNGCFFDSQILYD